MKNIWLDRSREREREREGGPWGIERKKNSKRVIQTNPSKFDEKLFSERERERKRRRKKKITKKKRVVNRQTVGNKKKGR